MAYSYYSAEKRADMELREKRKKEKSKMLEEIILGLTEDILQDDLTEEQMFLINYYGLYKQEISQRKFDISNVEQMIDIKSIISLLKSRKGSMNTGRSETTEISNAPHSSSKRGSTLNRSLK